MAPGTKPTTEQAALPVTLLVKVCMPGGAPIEGASVSSPWRMVTTDEDGIATISLTELELEEALTGTKSFPSPNEGEEDITVSIGEIEYMVEKAGYGPYEDGPFAEGTVKMKTQIWRHGSLYADGAPGIDDVTVPERGASKPSTQRAATVLMAAAGTGKGTEYPGICVRRLTSDQAHSELEFHDDKGNITLLAGSKYETQPDGSVKRPKKKHKSFNDPDENILVDADVTIAGVKLIGLWNFKGADKFQWFSLKTLTVNYRHAVALVRLCKMLYAEGYRCLYTAGVKADDNRNDCHGWGRAIDISGAGKELPEKGKKVTIKDKDTGKVLAVVNQVKQRPNKDFILFFEWGKTKMLIAKPTNDAAKYAAQTAEQKDLLSRYDITSGYTAERQAVTQTSTSYETDPAQKKDLLLYRLGVTVTAADRAAGTISDATHLKAASELYQKIYEFVRKHYSAKRGEAKVQEYLGPAAAAPGWGSLTPAQQAEVLDDDVDKADAKGRPDLPQAGSEKGHVFTPEYPKAADPGKVNGREPHANHFHVQLGQTWP